MKKRTIIPIFISLILFSISCAPAAAPASIPTLAPSQVPAPASNLQPPTSQDITWGKTMEAAKKESSLTLYSYAFTGDLGLALSKAFTDKYGIKVEIVTGRGAEMVERLRTESRIGTVVADILEGSASHALTAKTAGITVPTLNIPAISEKDVWYASPLKSDPSGYAISYSVIVYNPYINSKLIKLDDAPKSFQDFLAPQWKGKIIATDPDLSITELNYFVPLLNQGIVTEDYLRSLGGQNLQYTTGEVERGKKISSGEFAITTVGTTATMVRFISEGAPVKAIRMKEGLTAGTIAISRVKNSPHPNAASLFIEWLLSAEGQQLHAKERATGSIRKGVTDYTPEAARVDLTGVTVTTDKDQEDSAQKFRDKWLSRMWKK